MEPSLFSLQNDLIAVQGHKMLSLLKELYEAVLVVVFRD